MAIKQTDIMYATGAVSLYTGSQPSINQPGTIVKSFKAGDKIGQAYGIYPFADGSGTMASTDGGYVLLSDPITNSAPDPNKGFFGQSTIKPAAGMAAIGSDLTAKSSVNFRDGASTTANILFTLNPGSQVTVTGYGGDGTWYKVTDSDNDIGYIKQGSYLSSSDKSFSAPASAGDTTKAPASVKAKTSAKKIQTKIVKYLLIAAGIGLALWGGITIFGKKKPQKS